MRGDQGGLVPRLLPITFAEDAGVSFHKYLFPGLNLAGVNFIPSSKLGRRFLALQCFKSHLGTDVRGHRLVFRFWRLVGFLGWVLLEVVSSRESCQAPTGESSRSRPARAGWSRVVLVMARHLGCPLCFPLERNGSGALLVMAGCHGPVVRPVMVADWPCQQDGKGRLCAIWHHGYRCWLHCKRSGNVGPWSGVHWVQLLLGLGRA